MWKFLAVLAVVLLTVQPSFAGTYLAFEEWGGSWYDVQKTAPDHEDSLMCWAAAAANALKWGHWETPGHDTEASIYGCFCDHWTNGTGSPAVGWQWWLNGRTVGPSDSSQSAGHGGKDDLPCDFGKMGSRLKGPEGGGAYWPSLEFRKYLHEESDPSKSMTAIDTFLHKGYGVIVGLQREGKPTGHVLTAWGFRTDDKGNFQGLFVTNSDNRARILDYLPIVWDGSARRWKVPTFNGYIREVWALEPRPA